MLTHHVKFAVHGRGGHKGGHSCSKQRYHSVDDAVELLEGARRQRAWGACTASHPNRNSFLFSDCSCESACAVQFPARNIPCTCKVIIA